MRAAITSASSLDSIPDEVWGRWNKLTGEERSGYIEHARLLMIRGYIESDDELALAIEIFGKKPVEVIKNDAPVAPLWR